MTPLRPQSTLAHHRHLLKAYPDDPAEAVWLTQPARDLAPTGYEEWQMKIREIVETDRVEWVRLREALWPGSLSDHDAETREYFERRPNGPLVFVAEADGRLVGFLELDYRKYAPGCSSSPVPFIEGWYVESGLQRRGIGRALIEAAETHARAAGHQEIASDTEIENAAGIAAHVALGYEEVERVVCFRRSLPGTERHLRGSA